MAKNGEKPDHAGLFLLNHASIRQTDAGVRLLVNELKKLKRETLILFHSDNGGKVGSGCNFPYYGFKSQLTEDIGYNIQDIFFARF